MRRFHTWVQIFRTKNKNNHARSREPSVDTSGKAPPIYETQQTMNKLRFSHFFSHLIGRRKIHNCKHRVCIFNNVVLGNSGSSNDTRPLWQIQCLITRKKKTQSKPGGKSPNPVSDDLSTWTLIRKIRPRPSTQETQPFCVKLKGCEIAKSSNSSDFFFFLNNPPKMLFFCFFSLLLSSFLSSFFSSFFSSGVLLFSYLETPSFHSLHRTRLELDAEPLRLTKDAWQDSMSRWKCVRTFFFFFFFKPRRRNSRCDRKLAWAGTIQRSRFLHKSQATSLELTQKKLTVSCNR